MRLLACLKESVPFVAMVLMECGVVVMTMISKAAMNGGMSNFVFVVYYNTLGILFFLPFFFFHISRNKPPPLTLALLWRFFLIGICGKSSFLILYSGIGYSSPTLSAALGNLTPIFTFLLVIIFRMEKIDIRSPSTKAKSLGTIVAVSGAFLVTFYKGAPIFSATSPSTNLHSFLQSGYSNWILGGLFLVIGQFLGSLWYILQTSTVKEYQDQTTVVFFYILFGTLQCAVLGLIKERNSSAWTLHLDMEMVAIVYSAVFSTLIRNNVVAWCLNEKGPLYVAMFQPLQMVVAVIGGIMFLGDKLYIGSVVGSIIIAIGFYTVMWGVGRRAEEEDMVEDTLLLPESEASSPNTHTPLLLNYE